MDGDRVTITELGQQQVARREAEIKTYQEQSAVQSRRKQDFSDWARPSATFEVDKPAEQVMSAVEYALKQRGYTAKREWGTSYYFKTGKSENFDIGLVQVSAINPTSSKFYFAMHAYEPTGLMKTPLERLARGRWLHLRDGIINEVLDRVEAPRRDLRAETVSQLAT